MATDVNFGAQQYFGFDPRALPNCALWLDAADSNTLYSDTAGTTLAATGSTVARWNDKSSNANYVSQSTAGNRPTYTAAGQNNQNVVTFTRSSSTYLAASTPGNLPSGTNSYSAFLVGNSTLANSGRFLSWGRGASSAAVDIAIETDGKLYHVYYGQTPSSDSTVITNTTFGFSGTFTTSATAPYRNGTIFTSLGTAAYNLGTTYGYLGRDVIGAYYLTGFLCEIILYSRALSTLERQQVEGYLSWKWGLQTTLPTGQPFKPYPPAMRSFLPTDISGSILWLDAADGSTLTTSGTSVTAWNDKTNNLAITIGGTGGLSTSGTDVTTASGGTSYFSVAVDIRKTVIPNLTAFIVYAWAGQSSAGNRTFWGNDAPNAANRVQFFSFDVYTPNAYGYFLNPGYLTNTTQLNTSATQLYTVVDQVGVASGTSVYFNGTIGSAGSGTQNVNTPVSGNEILYFAGGETSSIYPSYVQFREIVFYSSALSTLQRQQIEGYLMWKWGLQASIPASHPFRTFPPALALFVPTALSGCVLWLDGADLSTLFSDTGATTLATTGGTVARWNDKSTSGNYAVQATAGSRPTLSTVPNLSLTAVYFPSTSVSIPTSGNSSITGNSARTMFVVTYLVNSSSYMRIGTGPHTTASPPNTFGFDNNATVPILFAPYVYTASDNTFSVSLTGISLNYAYSDGSSTIGGGYNATTFATKSTSLNTTATPWYIGNRPDGGAILTSYVCEFLVYNRFLSTQERQQVEGYLAWKWGFQSKLPSTHPFAKVRP